jgi:hypothetical protein
MIHRRLPLATAALLAALALGGCKKEAPAEQAPSEAAGSPLDGLTPEQMEGRARAMSPARAESLGIIDTTIHVEDLSGDTLAPPPEDGVPPVH